MANESKLTITDGVATVTINPSLETSVEHRDGFVYRDLNGQTRSSDVPTKGKIRRLDISVPMGGISRADWTQLKDWMVAGTAVEVEDFGTTGTYYTATWTYKGHISDLDAGAFTQGGMTNPPYKVGVEVYEYTAP